MDISELAIRVLLLFLPGIICHFIVDALTVHRERQSHEIFLLGFLYGVLAYLIYGTAVFFLRPISTWFAGTTTGEVVFFKSLTDPKVAISLLEVGMVSLVGGLFGIGLSAGINHRLLHRVARRFKISRHSGYLNVWSFALELNEVRWATVRDLEHKLMFCGYIRGFSDVDEVGELLLTDVIVYNEVSGQELYRADAMYLGRKRECLTVEFPGLPKQSEDTNERRAKTGPSNGELHDQGRTESAEREHDPSAGAKRKRRSQR